MLDTSVAIETPEGVDLALRPAGPLARILAYAIDLLIRLAVLLVFGIALAYFGEFGSGLMLVLYFLLEWFYPVLFEVYRQGMTPGKRSMKIQVLNDDGTPVGWNAALVRNLLRAVDFLPFAYMTAIVSMMIATHFKRLGDLAAGTLVVYQHEDNGDPQTKTEEKGTRPLAITLSTEEQRALLNFSESRGRLSIQRQQELANILTPLSKETDDQAVKALLQFANGLSGKERASYSMRAPKE